MPPAPRLLTIGYEGRTVDELVARLLDHEVAVLVDVRLTPLSRKPGLSKRRLAATLAEAGVAYVHLPALGNPKDNRSIFRAGDPRSRARFRALLRAPEGAEALDRVAALTADARVALLCFERDVTACHRQLVSDALARHVPALEVAHV